ncbi:MAG TPA: prepilin-type N-terminal cleavage/methylation domain-containing protein [Lysobacter sp.]|nr:prepilin-type N-terminal cleavage/methylation domain-containing protein [Lysobacter sp.]
MRARGFTLIEVLLATALLAAGITLAFATVIAASRTVERGEAVAARNERMRAVESVLRRRLAGARAVPFGFDQDRGLPVRFLGERDRMRFVADLPDYLGRGGSHLHDLAAVRDGDALRLDLGLTMVLAGNVVEEKPPRPPETLARELREVRFRYRALGADGRMGEWQERWDVADQLPLLVEVTVRDGDGRPWPPLVVALPLAAAASGAGVPAP